MQIDQTGLGSAWSSASRLLRVAFIYFACYGLLFPPQWMPQVWGFAPQAQYQGTSGGNLSREEAERNARQVGAVGERAAELLKTIPRTSFDPKAVVAEVGSEPADLAAWVQEKTRYVPYRGILRGPRGVLMDRVGGSADRALLLARLIQLGGGEVRLANAPLDGPAAQAVVQMSIDAGLPPEIELPPVPETGPRQLSASSQSDAQQTIERLLGVVIQQANRVAELVEVSEGPPSPDQIEQYTSKANEAASDHWWVEYRVAGQDDWSSIDLVRDWLVENDREVASWPEEAAEVFELTSDPAERFERLDPTSPESADDAATAEAAAEQEIVLEPYAPKTPFGLPARLFQKVELRIVIERSEPTPDGVRRIEEVPIAVDLLPASLAGEHILIGASPLSNPVIKNADSEEPARISDFGPVVAETEWLPSISIGTKQLFDSSVLTDGTLNPSPRIGAAVQKIGAAADALSRLGQEPTPVSEETHLTAGWIEYRVYGAGGEEADQVIRREWFDITGPAERELQTADFAPPDNRAKLERALALAGSTRLLVLGSRQSGIFPVFQLLRTLVESRESMMRFSFGAESGDEEQLERGFGRMPTYPNELYALSRMRFDANRFSAHVYVDRPTLLAVHERVIATYADESPGSADGGPASDRVGLFKAIDIVDNPIAVRPDAPVEPRRVRIEQGVADTAVEQEVISIDESEFNAATNTSALMARAGGPQWHLLKPSADTASQLGLVQLSATVKHRIATDLANGNVVIAPESAVHESTDGATQAVAWWRIDPTTGQTLGIGPKGWGSGEIVAYETNLQMVVRVIGGGVKKFGPKLFCWFVVATAKLLMAMLIGAMVGEGPMAHYIGEVLNSLVLDGVLLGLAALCLRMGGQAPPPAP